MSTISDNRDGKGGKNVTSQETCHTELTMLSRKEAVSGPVCGLSKHFVCQARHIILSFFSRIALRSLIRAFNDLQHE
jgi:hypothetical protein